MCYFYPVYDIIYLNLNLLARWSDRMAKILVCDDEKSILNMLKMVLEKEKYEVMCAENGKDVIEVLKKQIPDLIILDVMLPDESGFDILKKIAPLYKVPIIMLTAKNDIVDKVIGLEFGADDYITKPFDTRELIARVKALLRRIEEVKLNKNSYAFGDLIVNFDQGIVKKRGEIINLTPKEFVLLKALIDANGNVLTREELLDKVWGYDYYGDTRVVDINILRLRKKIEDDTQNPKYIQTVYGFGYKFDMGNNL